MKDIKLDIKYRTFGEFKPTGIVLHSMAEYLLIDGKLIHAPNFLHSIRLSAHSFIDDKGNNFIGLADNMKGLHAGKSVHGELSELNHHYLGIEYLLSGVNEYGAFIKLIRNKNPFTWEHYKKGAEVIGGYVKKYDIPFENIVLHSEVSGKDVRSDFKEDPGVFFDYEKQIALVKEWLYSNN
jgi:N-acetyl-anhydromuramyl-L-alanine amidase AmpD